MTDSPAADPGPVDPDVELASAHLDGEAGPAERARAQDPAVRAHLAAFDRVADQVRDVPPPPSGLLDRQVTRAMAAFDDEHRVAPIGRSRQTATWWQQIPLGAVAAVLVVVALIGVASLASLGGDDDDDTATAAFDSAGDSADQDDSAEGGSGAAEESTAEAAEDTTTFESEAGLAPDRASYDSYDDLAADLRSELAAPAAATTTAGVGDEDLDEHQADSAERSAADGEGRIDPCGAVGVLGIDPGRVVLRRPAVVGADEVTVVVHDAEDGRRLAAVDDATCTVVLDRPL